MSMVDAVRTRSFPVSISTYLRVAIGAVIFVGGLLATWGLVRPWIAVTSKTREEASLRLRLELSRLFRLGFRVARGLNLALVTVQGRQSPEAAVVVANHPSLLDVAVIASVVPDLICISKERLFRVPLIGGIARSAGYISNRSIEDVLVEGEAALRSGHKILFFPEGTRTPRGGPLGDFSSIPAGLAIRAGMPVQPVIMRVSPDCLVKSQPLSELNAAPFEFVITLCDSWRLPGREGGIAAERSARTLVTGQLETFFSQSVYVGRTTGGFGHSEV